MFFSIFEIYRIYALTTKRLMILYLKSYTQTITHMPCIMLGRHTENGVGVGEGGGGKTVTIQIVGGGMV